MKILKMFLLISAVSCQCFYENKLWWKGAKSTLPVKIYGLEYGEEPSPNSECGYHQTNCTRCECFESKGKLWLGTKPSNPTSSECGLDQCEKCP